MKKIGQILKDGRSQKKYSYSKLEEITKIKSAFIKDLEKENWKNLPSFPTVMGFVRSISKALDISEETAVAVLKRDYLPSKTNLNPKPALKDKPSFGPRATFILGIALVVFLTAGYLVFQYVRFTNPPKLNITSPKEGQAVSGENVLVFGSTDTDAKIKVDNQPVLVDEDGKFSVNIAISQDTNEIVVVAISRSGKETTVRRTIKTN